MRNRLISAALPAVPIGQFAPKRLPAGSKAWYGLELIAGLTGTVSVPAAVVRGTEVGPLMLVTAGVHGDEFEGMEAIRRFFDELRPEELRGTFVGIPVVNPFAYEGQMRETPALWDGLNLARQFPGRADGSLTQQLAKVWYDWVIGHLNADDVFIDFHSAGTRFEYVSLIAYHRTGDVNEERSRALAAAFGMKRIWRIPDRPDTHLTFNGSISRSGIPTIATESRGRGGIVQDDITELTNGLHNIIRFKGMSRHLTDAEPSNVDKLPRSWSTEWLWIQHAGLFRPYVALEQKVEADTPLGCIVSITGEQLQEVKSPVAGTVWGIRTFSTAVSGDYVLLIGYEEEEQS